MVKRSAWVTTALMTLCTLAAIELGFQIHSWLAPPPRWIAIDRYPANPRGYFRSCGEGVFCPETDRAATHGCDAPVEPGKSQVLFVGDSFTYGQGVDAADSYPSLIEFPQDQRRNCAVSGSDVRMVHDVMVPLNERYHPRLVVYGMVLNDFGMAIGPQAEFDGVGGAQMISDFMNFHTQNLDQFVATRPHSRLFGWLLSGSATARYFYRAYVLRWISRLTLQGYRNAFQGVSAEKGFSLIRDMASRNPHFLVVLFPLFIDFHHYPLEDLHAQIRQQLARDHIEVLDLLDVYRGQDAARLMVFPTDQHPNEDAHRMAAEALRARLRQMRWPPFE